MKTIELKTSLIELIGRVEDNKILKSVFDFLTTQLRSEKKEEFLNQFSDEQKKQIEEGMEEGLAQIKRGEVIPQEEALKKIRERYGLRK